MLVKMESGSGSGGNAQYEKTQKEMVGSQWTPVNNIKCSTDDLLMVFIHDSSNHSSMLLSNGDGTYISYNTSSYTNIRINNGQLEFYYNWTGGTIDYDVDYCYSV